jgi:hypothetical protein
MKETNPVEQRIIALAEKWKETVSTKDARIIRLYYKQEEDQMVDAFVWYMLGTDSEIDDIAFILDPPFTDTETYSRQLLSSLDECIRQWNETTKKEGIEYIPVHWRPDYTLEDDKNPAALFVHNFNKLSKSLALDNDRYTVATLTFPHIPGKEKQVARWMEYAIKAGIDPEVRYFVMDTNEIPVFDDLSSTYSKQVIQLIPAFDMKNIMKQVAAMGDPSDPATPYRIAFVNMMNAIGENDFKTAEKEGKTCIDIATNHITHNPQWAVQVVVVNIALANAQTGQKEPEKAIKYAGLAIKAAVPLPETTGADMGYPVLGQSYMTRGAIHCYSKEWKEAVNDFAEAASSYGSVKNWLMAMEANRMAGFCAAKAWQDEEAVKFLSNGFRMAEHLDKNVLMTSTFPVLLKQLLSKDYDSRLKYEEIDTLASTVYGEQWREAIDRTWKHSPDVDTYYEGVSGVTDSAL